MSGKYLQDRARVVFDLMRLTWAFSGFFTREPWVAHDPFLQETLRLKGFSMVASAQTPCDKCSTASVS